MAEPHSVLSNFSSFYESWLNAQPSFLQQLLQSLAMQSSDKEEVQLRLINKVFVHYQQYYEELSRAAAEDVFQVISAPWLTSFERTLLWISGFKPSIVFRLLATAVNDLTSSQAAKLEDVKAEVRRKERELIDAMASVQGMVAAPPILELARRAGRLVDGEICRMNNAIGELKMRMLGVFDAANFLRGSTIMKIIEILNYDQTVRLLVATTDFQLQTRNWGLERDLEGRTLSSNHL